MTCENIEDEQEAVATAAGLVAEVSAERTLIGLELMAERDGVGAESWAQEEAGAGGLRLSTVVVAQFPSGLGYAMYQGYLGLAPEVNASVSRGEALAFIAGQKARLAMAEATA